VSGRTYYRAVMPPEAWNHGREPRERRRRRRAVDDLIAGLYALLVLFASRAVLGLPR